ncbi:hypothetical protein Bca52824_041023 [Brassica carinata]|uniref:Uncharacterized protein n=1 Tax=Brassica carinata TaxID=52824 RepID=A0A8X7RYW2_BRACI|nr:hypothetical protein Bca52824_041023 [Brassica carinata]
MHYLIMLTVTISSCPKIRSFRQTSPLKSPSENGPHHFVKNEFQCDVTSAVVATIAGDMEGHTKDIRLIKGGLLGVVAGVITTDQLFGVIDATS